MSKITVVVFASENWEDRLFREYTCLGVDFTIGAWDEHVKRVEE